MLTLVRWIVQTKGMCIYRTCPEKRQLRYGVNFCAFSLLHFILRHDYAMYGSTNSSTFKSKLTFSFIFLSFLILSTQTLYPLPAGSFLLRPHETSSSQYFLSFRTVGTTSTTSTSSSSTGGGKNGNGRLSPESTVKHAIIRKTYTPASVPSVPVDTTTIPGIQPASPMKPCTAKDGNTSPLPMLLRQPPVHSSSTNTSRNATMLENGNHSAASESDQGGYAYQCGKIGPCATMIEMLR